MGRLSRTLRCFATATVIGVVSGNLTYRGPTATNPSSLFRFRLVVNDPQRENEPSIFYCLAYGKTADTLHSCIEKNDRLFVSGAMRMRKFHSERDDRDWILPTLFIRDYMFIPRAMDEYTARKQAVVQEVPDSTVV